MAKTIRSTFDTGLDGWSHDPKSAVWRAEGGHPGGYMEWRTTDAPAVFVDAPTQFLGDMHKYFNGTLSLDFLGTDVQDNERVSVLFYGADGSMAGGAIVDQDVGGWQTASITLNADDLDYFGLSNKEIKHVLSNVTRVEISIASSDHHRGGLDNIIMSPRGASGHAPVWESALVASGSAESAPGNLHFFASSTMHLTDLAHLHLA